MRPSRTCFGWHGRWASRSPRCLRPSASAPSGPVYDKRVSRPQSCRHAPRTLCRCVSGRLRAGRYRTQGQQRGAAEFHPLLGARIAWQSRFGDRL
jgi:hypothetical protein